VIGDSNLYKHSVCIKKIHDLEENIKRHQETLETTRKKMDDLRNDRESLERYAREEFLMKKENEDIYIIEDK
jgi:cell division protein FtsB